MFYSHQLLARKAPLGQIWMAATLGSKIKRRSLDKLDISRICEEILNPSIPMALRLSGILMGGVVNVFKRKVDFLYDDVNRFLDDLNRVFKTKIAGEVGKTQVKNRVQVKSDAGIAIDEKDQSFDVARFQNMTLEDLDDRYIGIYVIGDDEPSVHPHHHHQADPADITLPDKVDFGAVHTGPFDRFERFDIGDDVFSQTDFTSQVLPDSPPRAPPFSPLPPHVPDHDDPMMSNDMKVENQPPQAVQHEEQMSPKEEPELRRPVKRKARGNSSRVIMDMPTMIPSEIYHSWLNDASDISSLRRRRTKPATHMLRSTKIDVLMDLPPLCLMSSSKNNLQQIHYPEPLMELWKKSTMGNPQTPPAHQNRTSHSFPEEAQYQEFENIRGNFDIDKMMAAEDHNLAPSGVLGGFTSSGSHGEGSQPIHSSEPLTSGRSNKRQTSLSIGNLDTVAEDVIMPDLEPLQETWPTQTPCVQAVLPAFDRVTESIRNQLKSHFDTPGNSQAESLNNLADGLTRKRASLLFYHTCVMATMDYVKVEQLVPYGDISISRGPKM